MLSICQNELIDSSKWNLHNFKFRLGRGASPKTESFITGADSHKNFDRAAASQTQ